MLPGLIWRAAGFSAGGDGGRRSPELAAQQMVIVLARTGQAFWPALMLGASNNLLSRIAVGSSYSRYSGGLISAF